MKYLSGYVCDFQGHVWLIDEENEERNCQNCGRTEDL